MTFLLVHIHKELIKIIKLDKRILIGINKDQ